MEPFIFFKKHKKLLYLFLFSILLLIMINYVFPEAISIYKCTYISGNIFTNLSLGYLVSLIFYYLVVYLKVKKDFQNIAPRISKAIIFILDEGDSLEIMLYENQQNRSRAPDKVTNVCKNTNLYDINYSINNRKSSWIEYLKNNYDNCQYNIDKILKIDNVDSELIKNLNELEDIVGADKSRLVPSKEGTMEPLTGEIIRFFKILDNLETYWEANYEHFKEHKKIRRFKDK